MAAFGVARDTQYLALPPLPAIDIFYAHKGAILLLVQPLFLQ